MEEDNEGLLVTYNRSGNFSHKEVKALVEQIKIHKDIILNKCTNAAANFAKEKAWEKICKEINKKDFEHKRTVNNLKTKWLNLKKSAKKVSQNILDMENTNLDDVLHDTLVLIHETGTDASLTTVMTDGSENNTNASMTETPQEDSFQGTNDAAEEKVNLWDDNAQNQSDESDDADNIVPKKRRRIRTLNFSPSECSLLLKCVREEMDSLLVHGKGNSTRAVKMQNSAWNRITNKYNRLCPRKRTNKVLRTKFDNMKRLTNRLNMKNCFFNNKGEITDRKRDHQQHDRFDEKDEHFVKNIKFEFKKEPVTDNSIDKESDADNEEFSEIPIETHEKRAEYSDPLSTVLNGDSGMESISHFGSYTPHENKEIAKLKLELLKYQLETAKLERQRIKEALEAENCERQAKALETSLRLRAARLNAVASESNLPSTHPALQYTEQEKLAQQYMRQFEHT